MAVSDNATPGKKRALDATVSLVPFIDLLTCCISFLLITAVWTQLSALGTRSPAGSEGEGPPAAALTLTLDARGFTLDAGDGAPRIADGLASLPARLAEARARHPEAATLHLRASDDVAFARLILALDEAHGAKFDAVDLQ